MMKHNALIGWVTLATLMALGVFLTIMCVIVRHVRDIQAHPGRFVTEIALVTLSVVIPYIIIALMRRASTHRLPLDSALLVIKVVIMWVLFEISGFNTAFFPAAAS